MNSSGPFGSAEAELALGPPERGRSSRQPSGTRAEIRPRLANIGVVMGCEAQVAWIRAQTHGQGARTFRR